MPIHRIPVLENTRTTPNQRWKDGCQETADSMEVFSIKIPIFLVWSMYVSAEFKLVAEFIRFMMNWLYILDDNPSNQIRAMIKLRLVVNLNRISFLAPTKITQIDRFQKMEFQNLKLCICTRNLTIMSLGGHLDIFQWSGQSERRTKSRDPKRRTCLSNQMTRFWKFLNFWHKHFTWVLVPVFERLKTSDIKNAILFQRQSLKNDF